MSSVNEEPPNKKCKRNDVKCCKCEGLLRKGNNKYPKKIQTRKEAEEFFETYHLYVQPNDILCEKCYAKLRASKSRLHKNVKLEDVTEEDCDQSTATMPEQATSTLQNNDVELSQALSEVSIDQDEIKPSIVQSSQESTSFSQESSQILSNQQPSESSTYYPTDESEVEEIEFITMPFERTVSSKAYCFICGARNNIIDVPLQARLQVFMKRRLFIPNRNRCCPSHIIKNRFYENQIPLMSVYSTETVIEPGEVKKFIEKLSIQADVKLHDKIGQFILSEERVKAFTGHSWSTIKRLEEILTTMRKSSNRNITQALVIFLFKLRSGNSNALIAAVLEVSESIVENSISSILKCFQEQILPENFGVTFHTREFLLQEQAKVVEMLYDVNDTLFIICDGTYLRHEKSSNNAYQRKSYSGQKKVPLCKPFTICTTNGYIIDLAGPFEATVNDATILKHIL